MQIYTELCLSFSVPLWVAPLLHAASRLRSDPVCRRKTYRLIQRRLWNHQVGCRSSLDKPTYVYPPELKQLIRTAFPQQIRDYEDPQHQNVVVITMDELYAVSSDQKDQLQEEIYQTEIDNVSAEGGLGGIQW